jgi:sulfate permease, SulP family
MSTVSSARDRARARDDLAAMLRQPRRDLTAGLTVAIVALPVALGFGISPGRWRRYSVAPACRCPGRPVR